MSASQRLGRQGAVRCECCGHPLCRDEVWHDRRRAPRDPRTIIDGELRSRYLAAAERVLREGREPAELVEYVHYSPCDEGCRHGGPVRARHPHEQAWEHWGRELTLPSLPATYAHAEVQASWRPVATRATGVLCLRCYAERLQP
jgi:hypothetical protein